jgi:hypothetical protein
MATGTTSNTGFLQSLLLTIAFTLLMVLLLLLATTNLDVVNGQFYGGGGFFVAIYKQSSAKNVVIKVEITKIYSRKNYKILTFFKIIEILARKSDN